MKTVLLANNRLGLEVANYLLERKELVGIVLNEPNRQKFAKEIVAIAPKLWVWPNGYDDIEKLKPDCIMSVLFAHRVPRNWLQLAQWESLNLHPGFLPYNRGSAPNVWPLVDGSTAGTTLHIMTDSLDKGPILSQTIVPTYPNDTAVTLYERLEIASLDMLKQTWAQIEKLKPLPQVGEGSEHQMKDLSQLDLIESDLAVIDKLRARTFPPYGAEFERKGIRYRVRIEIERLD